MATEPQPPVSPMADGEVGAEGRPMPLRRRGTTLSSLTSVTLQAARDASTYILNTDIPSGFLAASAAAGSNAPSLDDVRRRSSKASTTSSAAPSPSIRKSSGEAGSGDSGLHWFRRRGSKSGSRTSTDVEGARGDGEPHDGHGPFAPLTEEPSILDDADAVAVAKAHTGEPWDDGPGNKKPASVTTLEKSETNDTYQVYRSASRDRHIEATGSVPPTKIPWTITTAQLLKAFWRWFITPFGFLITLYGLNVVAWGGMLFLLLCNASPAMCSRDTPANNFDGCDDIDSPRRIWIEIDSQILNALFCVTGFGLFPWRARDLYYLLRWRLASKKTPSVQQRLYGLRVLAGIYKGWFRLPGNETVDHLSAAAYLDSLDANAPKPDTSDIQDDVRIPLHRHLRKRQTSDETDFYVEPSPLPPPLTGVRAPSTALWKVDFFVWMQILNTVFQCCLCGFMWGMDRYTRPSWSTGLFVALACGVVGVGGLVSFFEGRKVKRVEGTEPRAPPVRAGDAGYGGGDGRSATIAMEEGKVGV